MLVTFDRTAGCAEAISYPMLSVLTRVRFRIAQRLLHCRIYSISLLSLRSPRIFGLGFVVYHSFLP